MTAKPDYAAAAAREFFLDAWTEAQELMTGTDTAGQSRGAKLAEALVRAKTDLAHTIRHHFAHAANESAVDREALVEAQRRARLAVGANLRVTKLLRDTLPERKQHGNGLDGMVQSLLAYIVELQKDRTDLLDVAQAQAKKLEQG